MLFYTRRYFVAKGKISVDETDTNSMKLEKWLQFEIGPKAFICTSMTATANFGFIVIRFVFFNFESVQILTNISKKKNTSWLPD